MELHVELTDREFEDQFASGELKPELFSHEAHLRLAWIQLTHHQVELAIQNVRTQLQKFVRLHGAQAKYNETLTIAAVRVVYHFMIKSKATNFKDFIAENPRLKFDFKELISSHYQTNIFASEQAKKEYVEPELLPFD